MPEDDAPFRYTVIERVESINWDSDDGELLVDSGGEPRQVLLIRRPALAEIARACWTPEVSGRIAEYEAAKRRN